MSKSYRLSSGADVDLAEIWLYIARNDLPAADSVNAALRQTFGRIAQFPMLGEACPTFGEGVRVTAHPPYAVYYQPEPEGVYILRVIHGARDTKSLA